MATSDSTFIKTALRRGFITAEQADACRREANDEAPVTAVAVRKGFLTDEQVRSIHEETGRDTEIRTPGGGRRSRSDLIGRTIGGCLILGKIGEGGMGTVFRASHLGLEKTVAVKVLPEDLVDDDKNIKRFMQEARTLARADHENIVSVYHVGQEGDVHYLVMQYLQGENLSERIKKGRLEAKEAAAIVRDVAKGLQGAHKAGVIHRDLKPHNIFLTGEGQVKVLDFGLAREQAKARDITQSGQVLGTPYYMSPEQCQGQEVDPRADLYSLGVTLYHALTGEPPYTSDVLYELFQQHVNEPAPDPREKQPDIPEPLCRIVMRLMAKDPSERYPDAREAVRDLERFLSGEKVLARPHRTRRRWWLLAPIVLIAFVAALLYRPPGPDPKPEPGPGPRPEPKTVLALTANSDAKIEILRAGNVVHSGGPGDVELEAGDYEVVIQEADFRRVESVTVEKGKRTEVAVDPREKIADFFIETRPDGAAIEVDGRYIGRAPITVQGLDFRKHSITISAAGFVLLQTEFVVERREGHRMFDLLQLARVPLSLTAYGRRVKPEGVGIFLDDKRIVDTALRLEPERMYRVRIEHDELVTDSFEVSVKAGETKSIVRDLKAKAEWKGMVFVAEGRFWIDRYETTHAEYAAWVKEGGEKPRKWSEGRDAHPVRFVTWTQAKAYAGFRGKRLPTRKEWERAAGGPESFDYPWGATWEEGRANTSESKLRDTVPARKTERDRSPAGCHGMGGNIREWTATQGKTGYWMKGGSFVGNHHFAKTTHADDVAVTDSSGHNGIRCAADFLKGLIEEE